MRKPFNIKLTKTNYYDGDYRLKYEVTHIHEKLRDIRYPVFDNGDMMLITSLYPFIDCRNIALGGIEKKYDNKSYWMRFDCEYDREQYLKRIRKLFSDFNREWESGRLQIC